MRDRNWSQPEGVLILSAFFDGAEDLLSRSGLDKRLDFYFVTGTVNDKNGDETLHRPSYNLRITYGEQVIFIAYYELDTRFSLEISEEERERIEDMLANQSTTAIMTYGMIYFIRKNQKDGTAFTLLSKESDDKKFLSLN